MHDMRIEVGYIEGVPEYRTVSVRDVVIVQTVQDMVRLEDQGYFEVVFPHSLLLASMVDSFEFSGFPMMMAKLS